MLFSVKKYLIAIAFLFHSVSSFCAKLESVSIGIVPQEKQVLVYVLNSDEKSITISRNIGVGAKSSPLPLFLVLRDLKGEEFFIDGQFHEVDVGPYIEVRRGNLHGKSFSNESLKLYFNALPGKYQLKAIYQGNKKSIPENAFSQDLHSDWVDIIID